LLNTVKRTKINLMVSAYVLIAKMTINKK